MALVDSGTVASMASGNPGLIVEARLRLNSRLHSTHFITYDNGVLYDVGCDGISTEKSVDEFVTGYQDANWEIEQII